MKKTSMILALLLTSCFSFAETAEKKDIQFKFHQVEIGDLVHFIGKLDQKVIILDEKVKGKVSVTAPKKVSLTEAYQIVSALLEARKFNLIKMDQFLKVVPMSDAPRQALPVYYGADIDMIPDSEAMITSVIPIKKAKAATVLESLRPMISATGSGHANASSNLLIISEPAVNIKRFLKIIPYLDVPESKKEDKRKEEKIIMTTEVYSIKYLKAKEISDILQKVYSGKGKSKIANMPILKFIPVTPVNSLIITAPKELHADVSNTLKKLDIRRRQVLIELQVIEYERGKDFEAGIKFDYKDKQRVEHSFTYDGTQGLSNFFQYNLNKLLSQNVTLDAVLSVMEEKSLVKILARPKIFTADNQKATLNIGQEEPIVKSQTDLGADGGGEGKTVTDYIYKDVGLDLSVTPHININRDVDLDITFKMSNILAEKEVGTTKAPQMGTRQTTTNVTVKDGNTLILGGYTSKRTSKTKTGIPVLQNIPVLGYLFRKTIDAEQVIEMAVFITPHVVENSTEEKSIAGVESHMLNESNSMVLNPEYEDGKNKEKKEKKK